MSDRPEPERRADPRPRCSSRAASIVGGRLRGGRPDPAVRDRRSSDPRARSTRRSATSGINLDRREQGRRHRLRLARCSPTASSCWWATRTTAGTADWGLVRFGPKGRLDKRFGDDGKVVTKHSAPRTSTPTASRSRPTARSSWSDAPSREGTADNFGVFRYKPGGDARQGVRSGNGKVVHRLRQRQRHRPRRRDPGERQDRGGGRRPGRRRHTGSRSPGTSTTEPRHRPEVGRPPEIGPSAV